MPKSRETDWSQQEMKEIDPQHIKVQILGRIFEGRGNISSDLSDEQLPAVAEALVQSVERLDENEYSACVDGRRTLQLASGESEKLRPRKAGGGLTPFAMKAIASPEYRAKLSGVAGQAELFEEVDDTNSQIGRKESGHAGIMPNGELVYDCGAATGFTNHNQDVGRLTPKSKNAQAVMSLIGNELPSSIDQDQLVTDIAAGAKEFSEILATKGWDGQKYVAHLIQKDPQSVELLEAKDNELRGHEEKAIVIIDEDIEDGGEPQVGLSKAKLQQLLGIDVFVVNLNEIRRSAKLQAAGDPEIEARSIAANLLYHVEGVVAGLTDGSLPVFYLKYQP